MRGTSAGNRFPAPIVAGRQPVGGSAGVVTVELAVLLPGVVMLMAAVLAAATVGVAQLRCVDAARTGARLAARDEARETVMAAIRSAAPSDARIALTVSSGLVRVGVFARVRLPLPGSPAMDVEATSVAWLEEAGG